MNTSAPTLSTEDIMVRYQHTPNPMALKFITNQALLKEGKATFSSHGEAQSVPLARSLFNVFGVRQVYFFQNTITITHDGSMPEEELIKEVIAVLKTQIPHHNPEFESPGEREPSQTSSGDRSHLSEEVQEIEDILDRTIRPGLQADGGDIEIISFENGELRILFQGACGGCPSAFMGTLDAIQGILRQELGREDLIVIPI